MTYVGMAAAALGAIAGGFNLYEKHKDQFICGGPPRSMPRRIEQQILAGSPDDDDEYTSYAARASSRGDYSTDHLRFLQNEYKEELNESNEEGDWEVCLDVCLHLHVLLLTCRTCLRTVC